MLTLFYESSLNGIILLYCIVQPSTRKYEDEL